jgi:hypothetical protein
MGRRKKGKAEGHKNKRERSTNLFCNRKPDKKEGREKIYKREKSRFTLEEKGRRESMNRC